MSTFSDLTNYLARPFFTEERESLSADTLGVFLKLLGLTFVAIMAASFIAQFFFSAFDTTPPETTGEFDDLVDNAGFFMIVLAVPFFEELVFRLWLGKRWGILVMFPTLMVLGVLILLKYAFPDLSGTLILASTFTLMTYLIIAYRRIRNFEVLDYKIYRAFPYLFWGTSILFGLMHLGNFTTNGFTPLAVLIVLPQFIAGTVMGYVRMRFGFLMGFAFHASYNGVIMLIAMTA